MTTFDVSLFENLVAEGPMATQYEPVPEGEYTAVVEAVEPTVVNLSDGPTPALRIRWRIMGPEADEIAEKTGRPNPSVSQTIFLDVETDKSGKARLATGAGRNVQLGRLREAVGQNDGGKWEPNMLLNSVAKIFVTHSASKTNPEDVFANVSAVRPAE